MSDDYWDKIREQTVREDRDYYNRIEDESFERERTQVAHELTRRAFDIAALDRQIKLQKRKRHKELTDNFNRIKQDALRLISEFGTSRSLPDDYDPFLLGSRRVDLLEVTRGSARGVVERLLALLADAVATEWRQRLESISESCLPNVQGNLKRFLANVDGLAQKIRNRLTGDFRYWQSPEGFSYLPHAAKSLAPTVTVLDPQERAVLERYEGELKSLASSLRQLITICSSWPEED